MFVGAGCVCGLGRCLRLNILTADLSSTDNLLQVEHSVLDICYALGVLCVSHGLGRGHREHAVIV